MKIRQTKILGLVLLLGGMVLCGVGLWLLLSPAQYAATVRIKTENDASDSAGNVSYDPYFIQTSFEIIQSHLVLSNVVASLNLEEVWGKKRSTGSPLKAIQCYAIIRNNMRLTPVRNTRLVDITFYSGDPKEAAQVANAIAEAYFNYRITTRRELINKGLETLRQIYQDEEKQISLQPTKKQLLEKHKLLGEKIEAVKMETSMPKTTSVQIVVPAEQPQFPVSPNRTLGVVLFAVGLLPLLGGILLLKPSPQPAV